MSLKDSNVSNPKKKKRVAIVLSNPATPAEAKALVSRPSPRRPASRRSTWARCAMPR